MSSHARLDTIRHCTRGKTSCRDVLVLDSDPGLGLAGYWMHP